MFKLRSPIYTTTQMFIPVPTGGYDKGEAVTVNAVTGFTLNAESPLDSNTLDLEDSRSATIVTKAEAVEAPKATGAINRGQEVYLDGQVVTTAPTGNTYVGYALESVLSAATSVLIAFNGGDNV
jgi:hypothetical protein